MKPLVQKSRTGAFGAIRSIHAIPVLAIAALLGALAPGCGNPIADNKIDFWGDELPNVEPSEFHRPGQPCVLCHSVAGGASPELVIGGTVFADQHSFTPVEGVEVVLYDAVGDVYSMTTNCIGNFGLEVGDKVPQFPLAAEIRCPKYDSAGNLTDAKTVKTMNSWISRDGSCAGCHSLRGTQVDSTGWIFCNDVTEIASNPYPPVSDSCPGVPPEEAGAAPPTEGE
jgi:hypothetical protein